MQINSTAAKNGGGDFFLGVEGTGYYGADLARFLRARGFRVLEVSRPKRRDQRGLGKSDAIDAELVARAVLAGTAAPAR